ncbi:hypothetical protein [Paractinoplanes toevensis]|uniref:Uncharacterized protein n=1 Tax=Paractinoplanes toevensis TaxID=571911 RepID=A0A919W7D1_9ACTN|nr:hypothetical protein [Actinoplanes toevensis]GIM88866.1 hypothetical protein Ato02nite_006590 [Actinoplanes toevensis]
MTEIPNERECWYHAADCLSAAYKELGDAGDDLRGLADPGFFKALAEAKDAINRAKNEIRA